MYMYIKTYAHEESYIIHTNLSHIYIYIYTSLYIYISIFSYLQFSSCISQSIPDDHHHHLLGHRYLATLQAGTKLSGRHQEIGVVGTCRDRRDRLMPSQTPQTAGWGKLNQGQLGREFFYTSSTTKIALLGILADIWLVIHRWIGNDFLELPICELDWYLWIGFIRDNY